MSSTAVPYYSGSSLGPTSTVSFDDAFYYSFRVLDPLRQLNTSLNVAVMKTSAPPITVSRTEQIPIVPMPGDPVTVNIATSQPKCAEERIYLRWTTDSFVTSNLVPAAGSDKSYTATIPGQPAGTFVQYSIMTTATDLAPVLSSGMIDSRTLATTATFNAVDHAPPTPSPTPTPPPPTITAQPADKSVTEGKTARFTVSATGANPLRFQWTKNGIVIFDATRPGYTTPRTTLADNGALFAVTVSDINGSTVSNNATLTVKPPASPPSITTQPTDQTVQLGQRAKFTVIATGSGSLSYQWTKNRAQISGATRKAYTAPPATLDDNGAVFAVIVSNNVGSVVSDNATLTVE